MAKKRNPMAELAASYREEVAARTAARFEAAKVAVLMKRLGLAGRVKYLRRERGVLDFEAFRAAVPSHPFHYEARYLRNLDLSPAMLLPSLLKNFHKSEVVAAYEEVYAASRASADRLGRTVAMVFPRRGVPSGMVLYRTETPHLPPPGRGAGLLAVAHPREDGVFYVMRSLRDLAEATAQRTE